MGTFAEWVRSMDGVDGAGDEVVIAEVERRIAAEREACTLAHERALGLAMIEGATGATLIEREACAKVADDAAAAADAKANGPVDAAYDFLREALVHGFRMAAIAHRQDAIEIRARF